MRHHIGRVTGSQLLCTFPIVERHLVLFHLTLQVGTGSIGYSRVGMLLNQLVEIIQCILFASQLLQYDRQRQTRLEMRRNNGQQVGEVVARQGLWGSFCSTRAYSSTAYCHCFSCRLALALRRCRSVDQVADSAICLLIAVRLSRQFSWACPVCCHIMATNKNIKPCRYTLQSIDPLLLFHTLRHLRLGFQECARWHPARH